MGTIQGTLETFKEPISQVTRGWADGQAAKRAAATVGVGGQAPQYNPGQPARRPIPSQARPQGNIAQAVCPDPTCGTTFEVDTSQPTAVCPGCRKTWSFGSSENPPLRGNYGAPMGEAEAKRQMLLGMDRAHLDEYASENGMDPSQYPTQDSLVDALLGR